MSDGASFVCSGLRLSRTPIVNLQRLGCLEAGAGAFPDEVAFRFGDAGRYGHDHLAGVISAQGSDHDPQVAPDSRMISIVSKIRQIIT
jgi:hypothetical protein